MVRQFRIKFECIDLVLFEVPNVITPVFLFFFIAFLL